MEEVELAGGQLKVPWEGRWASDSAERFAIAKFGRRALSFFFLCRNPSSDWHGCMAAAGGWGQLQVGWGWGYVRGGTARHEALGAHV